jgi:hypothetical protein
MHAAGGVGQRWGDFRAAAAAAGRADLVAVVQPRRRRAAASHALVDRRVRPADPPAARQPQPPVSSRRHAAGRPPRPPRRPRVAPWMLWGQSAGAGLRMISLSAIGFGFGRTSVAQSRSVFAACDVTTPNPDTRLGRVRQARRAHGAGRAGQGRAWQGMAGQGRAGQGSTAQGRARQGRRRSEQRSHAADEDHTNMDYGQTEGDGRPSGGTLESTSCASCRWSAASGAGGRRSAVRQRTRITAYRQ